MLFGDGGDLADGVHGQVLGEGLAAEEAQPVHGVPLRQLEQGDGALKREKLKNYSFLLLVVAVVRARLILRRCREDYASCSLRT